MFKPQVPSFASPFYFLHISSLTICTYQFACQISDAQRHLRIGGRKKGGGDRLECIFQMYSFEEIPALHTLYRRFRIPRCCLTLYIEVYIRFGVADTAASSDSVSKPLLRLSQPRAGGPFIGHCQFVSLATFCRYRVSFSQGRRILVTFCRFFDDLGRYFHDIAHFC